MSTTVRTVFVLEIPGWHPTFDNKLIGVHWGTKARLKKRDVNQVAIAMLVFNVPEARGKRRVQFKLSGRWGKKPDPFAPLKSGLDALVWAGALVDDDEKYCECLPVQYVRGRKGTVITLEDV